MRATRATRATGTPGFWRVGLTAAVLALLVTVTARAQGGPAVEPAQLTVAGTRGAVETRTLLLRATAPITSLQIIPLDLTRADGATVLPASAIRAAPPADEVAAGGQLIVPVTFDLHAAPSGAFTGELLLSYHGGELTLPVTVNVKDPWALPLVVLMAGVGLGMGVSAYRAEGRLRDRVLVRVGQLRAQMRGDAELTGEAGSFRSRIEAHLVDVEAALQAEKWEEARTAVEQAEGVWIKWRRGRADWLAQLAYQAELERRLEELNVAAPYVQTVRRGMKDAMRDAPDLAGPDALRQRLEALAQQINRYVTLDARLNELNQLILRLPTHEVDPWQERSRELQRRLNGLPPADEAAYQALQSEVEQAVADVKSALQGREELTPARGRVALVAKAPGLGEAVLQLLAPAPSARPLTLEEQVTDARTRLRLFTWVSYALAVGLLAGAGFGELYVADATFGANAWSDYFALLAWGFGAEATRAAVAQMVRNWGLPGVEE